MSSLSGRTLGCVESMPEIISVYSYVGRGGGDVLTSSVNELYLSGGFIRGFFLLLPPPPPSSPPPLFLPLPSPPPHCLVFLLLISPLRASSHRPSTCSCSSASLSPYDPRFFVTDENSRYTKSALSKLAYSTFWAPGIIHEPAEKPARDES